jgi:hypothetical protein
LFAHFLGNPAMSRLRLAVGLLALAGCTQSGTQLLVAPVPKYDSEAIVQAILAEFDKNKNGTIEPNEAKACPALAGAFTDIDANRDRRLSADELRKRVEAYAASATGSVEVGCVVRLDEQPLAEATVTFVPETCMRPGLKTAVGTTDVDGRCFEYKIDGKLYRGLAPGLYKIQVAKDGAALAARFNSQTILGKEVFHDPHRAEESVELNLTSR